MQERQLAGLLIQMGLDRDAEIEEVVEELTELSLPSFVNQQVFRESIVDAAEAQLKRQLDERIHTLRQRIGIDEQPMGRVNRQNRDEETDVPESREPDTIVVGDDPPSDATTIWQPPEK